MSSILTHPDQVYYDPAKKLVKLFWNEKIDHALAPVNGAEYYLRAGIAFPALTESGGLGSPRDVTGFAVMVAYCFANRKYYVFGECEFETIDHVLNQDDNGIAIQGACSFFNKMWTTYFCDSYYWSGHSETVQKYILQSLRSPSIQPKPHFIEISPGVPGQQQQAVYELLQRSAIHWKKAGKVHEGFQMYDARNMQNAPCAVKAMMDCLTGMLRFPYKKPIEE